MSLRKKSSKPRTVFETPWFSIEKEIIRGHPHLEGKAYYRLIQTDSALVIPITKKGKVLLIRQYRPALGYKTYELPAGGIDAGETPEEAARRELFEETGYVAPKLEPIVKGRTMMDRARVTMFGFLARDVKRVDFTQRGDGIEVVEKTWTEFQKLIFTGKYEQLVALGIVLTCAWKYKLPGFPKIKS